MMPQFIFFKKLNIILLPSADKSPHPHPTPPHRPTPIAPQKRFEHVWTLSNFEL